MGRLGLELTLLDGELLRGIHQLLTLAAHVFISSSQGLSPEEIIAALFYRVASLQILKDLLSIFRFRRRTY